VFATSKSGHGGVVTLSPTERNLGTTTNIGARDFRDLACWLIVQTGPISLNVTMPIRELIEEIRLVPEDGKLRAELYGELAALINLANEHPRSKGTGVQITLVAGARSHLYRTRVHYERVPRK
jgi:hypothetical protein